MGRAEALKRVRTQFAIVAGHCARLEAATDDRDRFARLLALVGSARELRDRAATAGEVLERAVDDEGIARGVLE